jgi:ribosomal protein S6
MEDKTKDLGDIQVYELGYHILPTVPEEDLQGEVSKIHSFISGNDGMVISESNPTLKQLAYDVDKKIDTKSLKFNKAYFGWIKFEMDRSKVLDLKSKVEAMTNVLRFLIIKTVKESTISIVKTPAYKKEKESEVVTEKDSVEKVQIDEKELDKSIDELVVDESL